MVIGTNTLSGFGAYRGLSLGIFGKVVQNLALCRWEF